MMTKKNKTRTARLNLTDFSAVDDIESVSEDGLWALAAHVSANTHQGWTFMDLARDEKKPGVVRIFYEKTAEEA